MANEIKEPLSVEEPTAVVTPKPDIEGLIKVLEKAEISDPQRLQGKLEAGTQVGHLAKLLGDERKRSAELEETLRQQRDHIKPRKPDDLEDFMENPSGAIDIESIVARTTRQVYRSERAREAKEAERIQKANIEAWSRIQTDQDYPLIKDVWEDRLKDPAFVYQIQSGQVDPVLEYTNMVRGFYKKTIGESRKIIEMLRGNIPAAAPPHVERGGRVPANLVSESRPESEADKKIKATREKVDKGGLLSSEEELDIMDAVFGKAPITARR
jgi:hypothetical protein